MHSGLKSETHCNFLNSKKFARKGKYDMITSSDASGTSNPFFPWKGSGEMGLWQIEQGSSSFFDKRFVYFSK